MSNEEAIKELKELIDGLTTTEEDGTISFEEEEPMIKAMRSAIEALKQNKALLLLVEWAEECGFGYDNIPWLYAKYKRAIENKNMGYIEGLIYIAEQEAADGGVDNRHLSVH